MRSSIPLLWFGPLLWFVLLLPVILAAPARGDAPSLAKRCNVIPWEVDVGASDLYPAPLRAIQRELEGEGPGVVALVEAGLAESLNLRRIAAAVVAHHPSDRTRAILVRLLQDPDSLAAQAAAFALGEVGGAEILDALADAADGARPMVTHNALGALLHLGAANQGEQIARARLEAPQPFVRAVAVELLADVRGSRPIQRAYETVRAFIETETDREVAALARRTLRILEAKRV